MTITVSGLTPDRHLTLTLNGQEHTLKPLRDGWCVKRVSNIACVDVVRMLYNWRLIRSPRRPGQPHGFIERAWCYEGLELETLMRTLGQAFAWDGTDDNPPTGWIKQAL